MPASRVAALQRQAGNAAVGQLIRTLQRDATATAAPPPVAEGPVSRADDVVTGAGTAPSATSEAPAADAGLSSEDARRLNTARTTLAKVKPLGAGDEKVLRKLLAGTAIYDLMTERDALRSTLATLLMTGRDPDSPTPELAAGEHFVPRVNELADRLTRLDDAIQATLKELGVADESALRELVEERFPKLFLARAEEIALTLLDQNAAVARAEARRLGLVADEVGAGPGAAATINERMWIADKADAIPSIAGMKLAAGELAGLATLVEGTQADLDEANKQALEENRVRSRAADDDDMDWRIDEGPSWAPGFDPNQMPVVAEAQARHQQQVSAFEARRNELGLQYPVLFKVSDYRALATQSDDKAQNTAGDALREILDNIDKTKEYIRSGDLKVWNLREVFDITMQDLGIGPDSPLFAAVEKHVAAEERNDTIWKIARAAIAVVAAIITAIPSAGASLTMAASVVMLTASASALSESSTAYSAETAASNVALDPIYADISARSPDMRAVVLDLVAFGLDAAQLASAIAKLTNVVRAARVSGELGALAATARAMPELGAAGAERVLSLVGREAEVQSSIDRAVNAVNAATRPVSATEVEAEFARLGDDALRAAYEDMTMNGRLMPLTEDALRSVYGDARAEELITGRRMMRSDAFYDRGNGYIFLKDTSLESFSSTLIHETTHYLQNIYRPSMTRFMREFEAYSAQRHYLQRLIADGVDADTAFPSWKWLADASNDDIVAHLGGPPYNLAPPAGADLDGAVMDALTNLGRVEAP